MFSKFLKRPVLAIVLSVVIIFMGVLSIKTLPTSQFPQIAPPVVMVSASYPGASAKTLTESVIIPLEQAINGAWGMRYMASDATSAGECNIRIVFEPGTDINQCLVQISNRVEQVRNKLPELVQREGVIITPIIPSMLMYINLFSTDENANMKFLFNYAGVTMIPELQRINGIGQAKILGSRQYAMRIWLNPDRMRAYQVSPEEVMEALNEQSLIGKPGRIGRGDGDKSEALEYVLIYSDRYDKEDQYENVIIRANPDGELLRLKDIAEVELGSEYYDIYSNLNNLPSAAIVLKQTYGSNASEVIANVKAKMEELKKSFPPGMDYEISYDVSQFLDASMENVEHTLRDAFILVALVVFIFLGDWRSTLIPTLAVPISLIGAFIFMQAFGLTMNMITLFALVLAIGIVVDDAIVVVEAVHAKMEEIHCSPFQAVKLVMGEISGAVIAITLLMTAVFVPVAFMPGPVGVFYRQFSITMASSIVLSGLVALTLTPVLSAMILKNNHGKEKRQNIFTRALDSFNRGFEKLTNAYVKLLRLIAHRWLITALMWFGFLAGIYYISTHLASGFVPNEDQGMLYAIVQTPPGSTLERTNDISSELQELILKEVDGVQSVSSIAGYEVLTEGRGSNAGTCLINLKPWDEREHTSEEILEELEHVAHEHIPGATIEFFAPPAVPGFGAASGFALQLLDKTNSGDYAQLQKVTDNFLAELEKRPEVTGLFTFFSSSYPQLEIEIDNELAMQKGVSIEDAMNTLSIFVGSTYELGFIKYQRFFKVFVQAAPRFRRIPDDILNFWVKNDQGEMVPLSAFMKLVKKQGANEINRFNMYNTAAIRGGNAKGYSSGEAIDAVKEVAAATLPRGYDIDWAALSYDEAKRGNEAIYIFLIVLIFVYLVLSAQYESFIIPLAVILSLPAGVFGSFLWIKGMGLANDIYAQVGLVMLVGLLGKNAVLIVEFAVQKHQQGATILEAAIEGAKVRFRPILMTSFAFIAGLIPLVLSHGAGAIGNQTIGGSALGGMLFGTIFGLLIVPGLYYIFGSWAEGRTMIKDEDFEPLTEDINYEEE
ncbi:efflux RND transporter permease subunit [Parvicella tangerina]|uniref:Efflux pump membrane transporter BepE n=1 Tax=Parvicella tangerina TaxID=2829795 RepID=A0A916JLY8_9FLAO|nr:efflux RND transporter permease subunit [Parvicella tangerina]CAG5080562.1 Efflux pump membrane transporter BepE [Parvicella tangerina]